MSEGDTYNGGGGDNTAVGPGGGIVPIPIGVITAPEGGGIGDDDGKKPPFPIVWPRAFPPRAWDPEMFAKVMLAEFSASNWAAELANTLGPPPTDSEQMRGEVLSLIADSRLRAERTDEIMAQARDLRLYWTDALGPSAMRPATWQLIEASLTIGEMVGMHFKNHFQRARPVQYYPALMPLLLTPGHPSYPNNHALQSLLVAMSVGSVAPDVSDVLLAMADRIGHNREIAGVHFPSDRVASKKLADALFPIMQKGTIFRALQEHARAEWP